MAGPSQNDRKQDQNQGPSTGTMDNSSPPPPNSPPAPPNPLDGQAMPAGNYREEYWKEQTRDQQEMCAEMSKGRGQSDQAQVHQQRPENMQRR